MRVKAKGCNLFVAWNKQPFVWYDESMNDDQTPISYSSDAPLTSRIQSVPRERPGLALVGIVFGAISVILTLIVLLTVATSRTTNELGALEFPFITLFLFYATAYFILPGLVIANVILSLNVISKSRLTARRLGFISIGLSAVAIIVIIIAAIIIGAIS